MARTPDGRSLIGNLVRLDPTLASDRADLVEALDDPRVFAHGYAGGATDRVAAIERLIAGAGRDRVMYTIRLTGDTRLGPAGEVVGTTSLGDLDTGAQRAHAGWTAYRPALWGKGLNAEAKLLLLGHAFGGLRFRAGETPDRLHQPAFPGRDLPTGGRAGGSAAASPTARRRLMARHRGLLDPLG